MYLTLIEVAEKYKLSDVDSTKFCQFVIANHSNQLTNNPDLYVSGFESLLLDNSSMYHIVSTFLEDNSGYTVPTTDDIKVLRDNAVEAMATFLATQNFAGAFDFNLDTLLEDDVEPSDPATFLTGELVCTKDQMYDIAADIHTLLSIKQTEIATRNKH